MSWISDTGGKLGKRAKVTPEKIRVIEQMDEKTI